MRLDHVVIVVTSLADATAAFTAAGFTVTPGGKHDAIPTENALIGFADGGYLELLATRDPDTRDQLRALRAGAGWERHVKSVSAIARRFLPGGLLKRPPRFGPGTLHARHACNPLLEDRKSVV